MSSRAKKSSKTTKDEHPELKTLMDNQHDALSGLVATSRIGEALEQIWKGGSYDILNKQIFEPFEAEIVNSLKAPDFSIESKEQLYQFQASLRAINQIRERWQKKIKEGIDARIQIVQIKELSNKALPEEGV